MSYRQAGDDAGKLILRLTLAVLMLLHGAAKLMNFQATNENLVKQVVGLGLPDFVAYGVYVGEVLAPLMLIIGIFSRFAGLIILVNMVFAVVMVHSHQLFML